MASGKTAVPAQRTPVKSEQSVFVSPEMAAEWLETNESNRKIKPTTLASYVRDMTTNKWRDVGDPIRFADVKDEDGETYEALIDGQHRLTAVVQSGIGQNFTVIRHLSASDQLVLDSGIKRSLADTLYMEGNASAVRMAAMARIVWQVRQGDIGFTTNMKPSFSDLAEVIEGDSDFATALHAVNGMWNKIHFQPSVGAACYYWGLKSAPETTRDFFDRLASGADLREGDPALALRNRLLYDKRISRTNQLYLFLRSMNVARSGGRLAKIALPRGTKVSGVAIVREVTRLTDKKIVAPSDDE